MSADTIPLIAVVAVALILDLHNGFHDGCNAVSTVIYTGALKPQIAIGLFALLNFIGPLAMGAAVARTIGGMMTLGEKITKLRPINGFSAEVGGAIIIQAASLFGLPVSTTHVVTSAVTRTGLASHLGGVSWESSVLSCWPGWSPCRSAPSWPLSSTTSLTWLCDGKRGAHGEVATQEDTTHAGG